VSDPNNDVLWICNMKYKGYTGLVELEEGSDVLFGRVIGLRDVITFQGESVAEVTQAFHDSVDDYLEFCAERGESPEKPYSGQFVLRLPPALHRELAIAAESAATSLNAFIEKVLWEFSSDPVGGQGRSGGGKVNRVGVKRVKAKKK
jgi:predicted HicB family RNase H-like nuclease